MRHPDPEEMNDGVLDHRGETLPYLSTVSYTHLTLPTKA